MKPFVPKSWTGKLLLVGEAPGADEDTTSGRPFSGPAGRLLRDLWREAGYSDTDVALTNAVRCRPRKNAAPSIQQVRACRPFVLRVIECLKPQVVLGLGNTALRSLTNRGPGSVTNSRGRLLEIPGAVVSCASYVSYHPAAVLRGATHLRQAILDDLRRPQSLNPVPFSVAIPGGKLLAVDTEFSKAGEVTTVALANKRGAYAWETDFDEVRGCLRAADYLVGHSVAQDVAKLSTVSEVKEAWVTGEHTLDSLILARMVEENSQSYELENLLLSFCTTEPWKYKTKGISRFAEDWPVDLRMDRCRRDAWAAYLIAEKFYGQLRTKRPLVEYTHKIAALLERMAMVGAMVDVGAYTEFVNRIAVEKLSAEDLVQRAAARAGMPDFSPTNDTHIRELLFSKLGLKSRVRTETGLPSVDRVSLKNLSHPVTDLLMRFNKVEKLWSTYGPGIASFYTECGRVNGVPVAYLPFHVNPLGARTGRRSSSRPNSQNWPKEFRPIVTSRFKGGLIGDFDYSKLEVILIAWLAQEEKLFEYFSSGNGYIDVAKEMWGFEVKEGTPEYRATKSIILGVHYNMGSAKMAKNLWDMGVTLSADYDEHARKTAVLRRAYLRRFPRISVYMEDRERELLRTHKVVSLTGRERHLPLIDGENTEGYGHFLNQAINFPVQSLASDVTGAALIDIESEILRLEGTSYVQYLKALVEWQKKVLTNPPTCDIMFPTSMSVIINEVHDDVVVDIPPGNSKRDIELIVETMRTIPSLRKLCPDFKIPLKVGIKVANRWCGE